MEKIRKILERIVQRLYNAEIQVELAPAPKDTGADFASNAAMKLAKVARKSPILIAGEIKATFEEEAKSEFGEQGNIPEVNIAAPGFLNFILPDEYYFEKVQGYAGNFGKLMAKKYTDDEYSKNENISRDEYLEDEDILRGEYAGKTVVAEFSDPNPFKVLHVGHLYTSIVGDSISRLLETAGAKVVRANFGGDVGLHVAKTIWALERYLSSSDSVSLSKLNPSLCSGRDFNPTQPENNPQMTNAALKPKGSSRMNRESESSTKECCAAPEAPKESAQLLQERRSLDDLNDGLTIEKIAECYVLGTRAYEEDEAAKAEITRLNKVIYALAELGEEKSQERLELEMVAEDFEMATMEVAEIADLYWRGRALSYEYFKDFYAKIGVKFDKFYPESTVVDKGVEEVRAHVGSTYEESDGAIVYKGEKKGLHTRVFINREGVPTYETKDVGLIFTKWADWHFDESVVITGNEQADYMKVVLASVEEYAPELVERTRHLTHGIVRLPGNEKMSSRKGNFLKAVDVLEMIRRELLQASSNEARSRRLPSQGRVALPPRESGSSLEESEATSTDHLDISAVAEDEQRIILAAIKYAFLKYKMGGNIVFDPKESVSTTGNSGVYLLYSAVRAKKILAKSNVTFAQSAGEHGSSKESLSLSLEGVSTLQNGTIAHSSNGCNTSQNRVSGVHKETFFERELGKKMMQYEDVLDEAISEKAPYKICTFLYELAQEFSRFYENVKVAGSEREAELATLVRAYLNVMEHGLGLLGIEVPEEM